MSPDDEILDRLSKGDLDAACVLDENGFLCAPDEDFSAFSARVGQMKKQRDQILSRLADGKSIDEIVGQKLGNAEVLTPEILEEASAVTDELFSFRIDWVPAFFLTEKLSFLWGGCTIVPEKSVLPFFFIRKDFSKKDKWFIYSRKELLAHELCHVARAPLEDVPCEEHFAYMTSSSAFRRYVGNCFQKELDAILFIVPVFILLAVQILNTFGITSVDPVFFWGLAFMYPAFLLFRNFVMRRVYFKAVRKLAECGFAKPSSVLFRVSTEDVCEISKLKSADETRIYVDARARASLHWKIILRRFAPENFVTKAL